MQCCIPSSDSIERDVKALIDAIYPDLGSQFNRADFDIASRCILAPRHNMVDIINQACLRLLPGEVTTLLSIDTIIDEGEGANSIPTDVIHRATPGGLPPHCLHLKPGMPVIVLRNIDPDAGVCNGTRLIIREIRNPLLTAHFAYRNKGRRSCISIPNGSGTISNAISYYIQADTVPNQARVCDDDQ